MATTKKLQVFGSLRGPAGSDGVGISSVEQTKTSSVDGGENEITITLTNGNKYTATFNNGPKGDKGETGETGPQGNPGSDGVGIKSIEQTTTSTEDGGENVYTITLTNGAISTFKVKNGSKGSTGTGGKSAYQYAQEGGYTGTEDEFAAKMAEELVIDSILSETSTNPVQNKVITNEINQLSEQIANQQIELDKYASLTLGKHTDGLIYLFKSGSPIGNGVEITGEVVESGDVIGYVDENNNIVLSGALAEDTYTIKYETEDGTLINIGELSLVTEEPSGGNLADPSSADWQIGYRLSTSSGSGSALDGHILTNYIPAKMGDILRVKGLDITAYVNDKHCAIGAYNADKNYQSIFTYTGAGGSSSSDGAKDVVSINGDVQTYTILLDNSGTQKANASTAFIRIDGVLMDGYTSNDVVITINEEIV